MTMLQHPDFQAPAAAAYPAEVANFNLLVARTRGNERAPHYFGSFKLNGQWFQVSTWIRHSTTTGEQMLSNSVRPCTAEEAAKHEARDAEFRARAQPAQVAQNPLATPTAAFVPQAAAAAAPAPEAQAQAATTHDDPF